MRKLLNTLYVLSEDLYLSLDGDNVVAKRRGDEVGRIPLHTLDSIECFSYEGASPALMGACAERGICLTFFTPRGRFLADVRGSNGNVLLKKRQFLVATDEHQSLPIAKNCIIGKVYNSKWVLERSVRDHGMRIDRDAVKSASTHLSESLKSLREATTLDELRGIEGDAAAVYFSVFNELILSTKPEFTFNGRSRRPPLDPINAMLSLFYVVLSSDCSSALEGVGLDPWVGFMHADRPGRRSLALDLMEEFRPVAVDRFVLSMVNNRVVSPDDFDKRETGEVTIKDECRKKLFEQWQQRKREEIVHPFLNEKVQRGLVPHIQARLLSKCLRGDLDGYPAFLWK